MAAPKEKPNQKTSPSWPGTLTTKRTKNARQAPGTEARPSAHARKTHNKHEGARLSGGYRTLPREETVLARRERPEPICAIRHERPGPYTGLGSRSPSDAAMGHGTFPTSNLGVPQGLS
jgi:hypothetical protein